MKVEYNKEVAIQILDRQISCLQSERDKAKHDLMCIDLIVLNFRFSECEELSGLNSSFWLSTSILLSLSLFSELIFQTFHFLINLLTIQNNAPCNSL